MAIWRRVTAICRLFEMAASRVGKATEELKTEFKCTPRGS